MVDKRKIPIGIIVFIAVIIILDVAYLSYLIYNLKFVDGYLTTFLSFSIDTIVMWINAVLAILSLIIIPNGFFKRKNLSRIFAIVFLLWFAFEAIWYIAMTGEKTIPFLFFIIYVLLIMYLLMSSVKRYFEKSSVAIIPSEEPKEYKYGEYTLYSTLVRLRNEKMQLIYFFSKQKPKSGTPVTLPDGFEVEKSKRSGLPYLKKKIES